MIINKTSVSFAGRVPSPRYIPVGVVGDNRVECVEFKLPTIADSQTATMLINCKFADAITLVRTENNLYCADITSQIAGESGNIEAYIRINGTDGAVWNSEKIILCVCNVPDISGKVEEQEPTALDKNLSAIAVHKEEMAQHTETMHDLTETATKSAENAVDAAKRAEEAAKSAENKPGIPGKSAYQYAQDGGYEGTEADFAAKLAQEIPEAYTLPVAAADTLGGVKIGSDFVMDGETLKAKPENKYELISEVAYKEGSGVAVITLDTMPDGEPFAFKAVRITGSVSDIDIIKQFTIGYSAYSGTKTIGGNLNSAISDKGYAGAALFEVKHGMMTMEASLWSVASWTVSNAYWQPRAVYVDDGLITKITIKASGTENVFDGYAFKIEGVRA